MIDSVAFFILGFAIFCSSIFLIFTRNVVHGVYMLLFILLTISVIFLLLNAEFIAVVQIFLYAGGVVILFIFAVMLTNKEEFKKEQPQKKIPYLSLLFGLIMMIFLSFILIAKPWEQLIIWTPKSQIKEIGVQFMTDYILIFELISLLLLVVLIGVSFLAKKSANE